MNLDIEFVGFIGGGNMAKAIIEGVLKAGLLKPSQVIVSSPSPSTIQKWKELNICATHSNAEVIDKSDLIFLSFKPYQLDAALGNIGPLKDKRSKLFVSILAGVTTETVYLKLISAGVIEPRVIRVMPNTPAMVCEACSAIASHSSANSDDIKIVQNIFLAVGKCEVVQEKLMSVTTAIAGSGPAFVYMIIEALSDGAVKQGLPRDFAVKFAAQTLLGSAKMVLETNRHTGQLKDEVCSAGGTTIYGLHALEKSGLRATLMNAVEAAVERSEEIRRLSEHKIN